MRFLCTNAVAVALAVIFFMSQGFAGPIAITNADFESSTTEFVTPPGWTSAASGPAGAWTASSGQVDMTNQGSWVGYINGESGANPVVELNQTLGDTLEAGTYVLSADIAHFSGANQYANSIVELFAGTTLLVSSSSVIPADPGATQWAVKSWTFDIAASDPLIGQTLAITLRVEGGGGQGDFDNVELDFTAAIPEPSSLILVGIGMVGLLGVGSRRRR